MRTGFVGMPASPCKLAGENWIHAARAVQGHDFLALGNLFPRVWASQAREFQIAATTTPRKTVQTTFCTVSCMFFHKILQIPCFWKCVCMFLQCFLSKHGNLHICRLKTVPKHHFLQCVQLPYLLKPLKAPLFTRFSSIFPCSNAPGQLKYTKNHAKTLFFTVFLQCFPSKTPQFTRLTLVFAVFSMLWHP